LLHKELTDADESSCIITFRFVEVDIGHVNIFYVYISVKGKITCSGIQADV
jgi:hypothetical protein